ncbi:hypothetical protein SKAU_G00056810 [Synaphobranchus kaupii]|uniref:Uncharacterized protein n=1 Tax=Synaphobranchus kaupii TaxID=118154 RepID=A0A9Q1G4K5_SYNKA|nr:hypothetical protein SKAU_G00056810 [Synaphobranchus kaupii]
MAGPQDREPELACQGMDGLQKNQEGLQASGGTDDPQERTGEQNVASLTTVEAGPSLDSSQALLLRETFSAHVLCSSAGGSGTQGFVEPEV